MLKLVCIPAFNEEKPIVDVIKKSLNYADQVIAVADATICPPVKTRDLGFYRTQ